jgi:hypothetical protein
MKVMGDIIMSQNKKKKKCPSTKDCICEQSIMDRFQYFYHMLMEMSLGDSKKKIELLKNAPPCFIRLISECGLNILKGNLKLPTDQYKKLKPHKRMLLSLSKPILSIKKRKDLLLKKKGGFLPVILPFLLSAISGFTGQALAKSFL